MKLHEKKQLLPASTISVILLVPVLSFLMLGIRTGLFPKFWGHIYPDLPAGENNPLKFVQIQRGMCMVDCIEWWVADVENLLPLLSAIAMLSFIQMREHFLPFAYPRLPSHSHIECRMLVQNVFFTGIAIFIGYLLTMLWAKPMFTQTYCGDCSFDVFASWLELPLSVAEHPYLYMLAIGLLRYFVLPILYALFTAAVSYLTNKSYIYLLAATIYAMVSRAVCVINIDTDRWPLPLFSPHQFFFPYARDDWGFGHSVSGIIGLLCASLIIMIPSIFMIWYGMRKRRA